MTADDVARFRREIVDDGALPDALEWYRALPLSTARVQPNEKVTVPTTLVWSDRDVALARSGAERDREVRRRALRARRARGRQPLDPDPGAGGAGRRDPQADRVAVSERTTRPRAAAAPGRRQPLPPRHLARRRAGRRTGRPGRGRGGRRAPDRADRLRPAGRAVGGRGGDDVRRPGRRASRCTPTRRRGSATRLDDALAEIEALAASHDKVRAVGETGLDHFRTGEEGRAAQVESFRRHIDLAKRLDKTLVIHDRDAHDEVLRRARRGGRPRPLGDALLLRRRRRSPAAASTAAPTSPSPAR